jgi:hypothetical protein
MAQSTTDMPAALRDLIAECTSETFKFLLEPDKAEWLVEQIVSEIPLPPNAARPLAQYVVRRIAEAADAQLKAHSARVVRTGAQLAVAILCRIPQANKICEAIAKRLRMLKADALAIEEAERAIAERGYKVDPDAARRLTLDVRAGLRQLQEITELRQDLHGVIEQIANAQQNLCLHVSDTLNPQPPLFLPILVDDEQARFVFGARRVPFIGRSYEWTALNEFLDHEAPFLWWLATGPGGTGKSRLALEFCARAQTRWRSGFIDSNTSFDRFEDWQPFEPTLLVVDYAARDPERIGHWLRQLATRQVSDKPLQEPVRVLLLERSKQDEWWNQVIRSSRHVLRQSYYSILGQDVPLKIASFDEDRAKIAWHTIESLFVIKGASLPDRDATLSDLASIDIELRPLFAAFAADALLAGKEIRGWDRARLIEDVVDRSREQLWRPVACRVGANLECHEYLLRLATIAPWLDLDVMKKPPKGLALPTTEAGKENPFSAELYESMAPIRINDLGQSFAGPLEPDILGTAFVLTPPTRLRRDLPTHYRQLEYLAATAWRFGDPLNVFTFLDRATREWFPSQGMMSLLRAPKDKVESLVVWCRLVVNVMHFADEIEKIAPAMRVWVEMHQCAIKYKENAEIQRAVALATNNIMFRLNEYLLFEYSSALIRTLCEIANENRASLKVVIILAGSMLNMCAALCATAKLSDPERRSSLISSAKSCVGEIELIMKNWPFHSGIAEMYAQGIFNCGVALANAGDIKSAQRCVVKLLQLAAIWSSNEELNFLPGKLNHIIASDRKDRDDLLLRCSDLS